LLLGNWTFILCFLSGTLVYSMHTVPIIRAACYRSMYSLANRKLESE
jgi:hypothetical protein